MLPVQENCQSMGGAEGRAWFYGSEHIHMSTRTSSFLLERCTDTLHEELHDPDEELLGPKW